MISTWFRPPARSEGVTVVFSLQTVGAALAAGALAFGAASVRAETIKVPEPARPVDIQHLAGRWYEVARVPNLAESDCPFATTEWQPKEGGKFLVTQTCRKSESAAPDRTIKATADPLDPAGNTKWRMNYFGGLIRRDYWVIDHAADDSWVILGMPGKRYLWILSRQPDAPQAERQAFLQKVASLGYDASRLIFPVTTFAARGN